MNTINTLISKLRLTAVLAFLAVMSAGVMAHNHGNVNHSHYGLTKIGFPEHTVAQWVNNEWDVFSFLLTNNVKNKSGYLKATCYPEYRKYEKGSRPSSWTYSIPSIDKIKNKRHPGYKCYRGYVDISIDPDEADGDAAWQLIGRVFPCSGDKWRKDYIKMTYVVNVSGDNHSARLKTTCKKGNHHINLVWPKNQGHSDMFETLTNMPGEPRKWISNTNRPGS